MLRKEEHRRIANTNEQSYDETKNTASRFSIRYGVALRYLFVLCENRVYIQSSPTYEIHWTKVRSRGTGITLE
jgi:hypothetical protein